MTLKKINKADIVFENCDFVSIPVKEDSELLHFHMSGISESVSSCNLDKDLHAYKTANEVLLEFSKKALYLPSFWEIKYGCGNILKNQLSFRDICSVYIYCEENKEYEYYVSYIEENESELGSPNLNQINHWLNDGGCRVEIKKIIKE